MKKAVVILPTYNEAKNIENIITQIFQVSETIENWEIHIMVVDSSSPDKTADIVEDLTKKFPHLHLIKTKKEGLGKAYIQGFTITLEKLKPFVMFEMDADLSHDPKKIPDFLKEIENGADFVIGSRYMKGGSIPKDWGWYRKLLSVLGNWVIRLGFMKLRITDWTSGYRAIKSWLIQKHVNDLQGYTGYVFQVALLDNAVKSKANIKEVPIHFIDRTEGQSKINSFQYTVQTLLYVFQYSSFIRFALVGLMGFVIDFGLSFVGIEILQWQIWLATLVSTETAIVFNYLMNNYWSFAHKKIQNNNHLGSFIKFNLVSSGSILIQTLGVQWTSNLFGENYWYVYKVLIIAFIIIPYSYILYNKFIWKEK